MCAMFNSHAKASDKIHQVANKYADKVSDLTTTNGWLKILKNHRKYLNVCKSICCELHKKGYLVTLDLSPSLFHGKGEGLSQQCSLTLEHCSLLRAAFLCLKTGFRSWRCSSSLGASRSCYGSATHRHGVVSAQARNMCSFFLFVVSCPSYTKFLVSGQCSVTWRDTKS